MPYQRDLLPSFAGNNSFARAPRAVIDVIQQGAVAVVGIPYDGASTSRQGVRQGPRSIREASADFIYDLQASQSGALIDVISGRVLNTPHPSALVDLGDLQTSPLDFQGVMQSCTDAFSRISKAGGFPIALGGDRFITFPLVGGLASGLDGNVGLIRISGQLSLAELDSSQGPDWTGASLRRILDAGHLNPKNTVCIGAQGYIPYREWDYARDQGITVITADALKEQGPEASARRALELAVDGCDTIYISLDIGVVDSGYASGTADILVGGVIPRDLLSLMRELSASSSIAALDVVEVAPGLDVRGRSERLAAQSIIELIAPRAFGS